MKELNRILNILTGFRETCIKDPVIPTRDELDALDQAIAILDKVSQNFMELRFCVFRHESQKCDELKLVSRHRDFASASRAMQEMQAAEFATLDKSTSGKAIGCGSDRGANISYDTDSGLVSINFYVAEVPFS